MGKRKNKSIREKNRQKKKKIKREERNKANGEKKVNS